jgi:sigma-B regulation protein RsbU (phosphoserine phosphatase)
MEQQGNLYFTMWYGIYNKSDRTIRYGGGGHPPAILLTGPSEAEAQVRMLEARGPMVGAFSDLDYDSDSISLMPYAKLFLFSDGAYEIERADTTMWPFSEFLEFMGRPTAPGTSTMDALMSHVYSLSGKHEFADDFSIVEFRFEG